MSYHHYATEHNKLYNQQQSQQLNNIQNYIPPSPNPAPTPHPIQLAQPQLTDINPVVEYKTTLHQRYVKNNVKNINHNSSINSNYNNTYQDVDLPPPQSTLLNQNQPSKTNQQILSQGRDKPNGKFVFTNILTSIINLCYNKSSTTTSTSSKKSTTSNSNANTTMNNSHFNDTKYESGSDDDDPTSAAEEDKYLKYSLTRRLVLYYKHNTKKCFLAMILLSILLFSMYYYYYIYFKYHPQIVENKNMQEYINQTRNYIIKETGKQTFRSYSAIEYAKSDHTLNGKIMEQYLDENPDKVCIATIAFIDIVNYPYHVLIRNPHIDNNIKKEYIHMIYPTYNITDTTINGDKYYLYTHPISEYADHCIRLGIKNNIKVEKHRYSHIIVHYRGLDQQIYRTSLIQDTAMCIQHFSDIYTGKWPCASAK